jgi:uncharacterized membrane protein YgdD (TMEM256/DUF423 family)
VIAWPERLLGTAAGLAGVLGVALSAAAVHSGAGQTLETAARFLMFHAPALLGLMALIVTGTVSSRLGRGAAAALILGLALFSGDLAVRAFYAVPLFPMAAPMGGVLLMGGWLLVGAASLFARRSG